jgi:hypothetical protein
MVRDLPTGVVTLMFTDVEGSTRLWRSAATRLTSKDALGREARGRVARRDVQPFARRRQQLTVDLKKVAPKPCDG